MSVVHRATFHLDTATTLEAMVRGGRSIITGLQWWPFVAQTMILVILAPLGVMALFFVLAPDGLQDSVFGFPPLILLASAIAFLWIQRRGYYTLARISSRSRFNHTSTVEFTALGMTLIAPHSRWTTGWKDVAAVNRSKTVISIVVSGIVLPVPTSALDDPDAVFDDIQRWFEEAR